MDAPPPCPVDAVRGYRCLDPRLIAVESLSSRLSRRSAHAILAIGERDHEIAVLVGGRDGPTYQLAVFDMLRGTVTTGEAWYDYPSEEHGGFLAGGAVLPTAEGWEAVVPVRNHESFTAAEAIAHTLLGFAGIAQE
jgi:hypothetical protein